MVLAAGVVYGADGQTPRTEREKTSYAVGVQMGMDMKKYRMDLDPDVVAKGFRDAYTGGKLLLNDREMSQALADTEKQMAARSAGVNFMFKSAPPVFKWSILAADLKTAVGPARSAPCTGEMPSDSGRPALRPSGMAPVTEPK